MANKPMWDWMDKQEGRKEGSSHAAMNKERERQGYKKVGSKKKEMAKKMIDSEGQRGNGKGGGIKDMGKKNNSSNSMPGQ